MPFLQIKILEYRGSKRFVVKSCSAVTIIVVTIFIAIF